MKKKSIFVNKSSSNKEIDLPLEWNELIDEDKLPEDFCNNPPKFGWYACNINDIRGRRYPLFIYQDKCVEHKDAEVPIISYYTEAVGDIYRELSKKFYSKEYINQKINRLKNLFTWNIMDEIDKNQLIDKNKKRLLQEHKKRIELLRQVTDPNYIDINGKNRAIVPICKGDEKIADAQISSVIMLDDLIEWGLGNKSIEDIQNSVRKYIYKIKYLLDE